MVTTNKGTPKTLREAVDNGIQASRGSSGQAAAEIVEAYVRDFLAQRFGAYMLSEEINISTAAEQLFESITARKRG